MNDTPVDRETLKRLAEAPLADALKLNLPLGRSAPRRCAAPVYTDEIGVALTKPELKARRTQQADAKHRQLLDYYAGTNVPFGRIAVHLNMQIDHVRQAMQQRGRRD